MKITQIGDFITFEEEETELTFGKFHKDCFFPIEISRLFTKSKLPKGSKTVECLLIRQGKHLWLLEAKKSCPNSESVDPFKEYIEEICSKFLHSFQLFLGAKANAYSFQDGETPRRFKEYDFNGKIVFALVIKNAEFEWLRGIQNAIEYELRILIRFWKIEIRIFNETTAHDNAKIIDRVVTP